MNLLSQITDCHSLSIIGMAKNTGKTVCLNYILEQLQTTSKTVAVTSIGLDGEKIDQITRTEKPEVELAAGTYFVTSEYHYRQRQLTAEICQLSEDRTSLGRLVTAKVLQAGRVILSGPATTARIRELIEELSALGVDLTIIDGALSRKSPASPAITDGLLLTTGAAVSPDIAAIVRKTEFVYRLTQLPVYPTTRRQQLVQSPSGIYAIGHDTCHRLPIASPLLFTQCKDKLFAHGNTLFVSGIVTDAMLEYLRVQPNIGEITLVIKDFTKLFVTSFPLQSFLQRGGKIQVLLKPHLLAVCVNPVAPAGYTVDSLQLREALQAVIQVPVYDVKA